MSRLGACDDARVVALVIVVVERADRAQRVGDDVDRGRKSDVGVDEMSVG